MRRKIINLNVKNLSVNNYKVKMTKKRKNIFRFIIGVISYALFTWLILIGVVVLLYVGNNKLKAMKGDTSRPKYNAYVVLTGSMQPKIKVRDAVVTKYKDLSELEKDDIITFISSDQRIYGATVTHRIVEKYYDASTNTYTFRTKGDANNAEDLALVQGKDVLGKVIFKIPKIGYIQSLLATKGGWIIIVLVPSLAIIAYDIYKLIRMLGKKTVVVKK